MSPITRSAFDSIRNGRVENHTRLLESTDPKCNELQENARDKDEGVRMKDECRNVDSSAPSSFIPHPSALPLKPLTARQLTAINLLTLGKSVVAVAASLKLDPSTIHRWKASSPLFIAELNRRQVDAFDSLIVKMRLLMGSAVDELFQMMKSPSKSDRHEVMWKMLAMLKPQKSIIPTGPTEPEDVVDEQIRKARAARGEIAEAPIEDEDRLAHVRAEDLDSRGTGQRHLKNNATAEAQRNAENAEQSEQSAEREDHVPEARATANAPAQRRHAERSEVSGAMERQDAKSNPPTSKQQKTTPLPSREGLGGGAGGDELQSDIDRATTNPKQASKSDADEEALSESSSNDARLRQILHQSVQDDGVCGGQAQGDPGLRGTQTPASERSEDPDRFANSSRSAREDPDQFALARSDDNTHRAETPDDITPAPLNVPSSPAAGSLPARPCRHVPKG